MVAFSQLKHHGNKTHAKTAEQRIACTQIGLFLIIFAVNVFGMKWNKAFALFGTSIWHPHSHADKQTLRGDWHQTKSLKLTRHWSHEGIGITSVNAYTTGGASKTSLCQ